MNKICLPSTDGGVIAGVSLSRRVDRRTPSKQLVTGSLQFPHSRPNLYKVGFSKVCSFNTTIDEINHIPLPTNKKNTLTQINEDVAN